MTDLLNSEEELNNFITKKGAEDKDAAVKEYLGNLKYPAVPDFDNGLEWFNTSEPLSFRTHLRGKVVLLDFFTYCCINCMHVLPVLKELENEFTIEDGLVVVGVHSAKFENEKISANILSAVQRYGITHPVVNDSKSSMWNSCSISCWPTLLLVNPEGVPIIMLMGEGNNENLHLCIRNALEYYKSQNLISNHALPLKSVYHYLPDSKGPLLFPGKIASFLDPASNKELLAISDTGNHRVLVTNSSGRVIHKIGGNGNGLKDGNFKEAQFNSPQGLVFQNSSTIFVADTENHAIRKIDLNSITVVTIVGTGEQGSDYKGGEQGIKQVISSPWDVCVYKTSTNVMDAHDILFIAMAGLHQIWAYFFDNVGWWKNRYHFGGTCSAIAGCGREENKNNNYPFAAAFAQPSGLSLCEKDCVMYIADSESSSIRKISLIDGKVSAVVGGDLNPLNLFSFGDKDGKRHEAKLQHCLGVAASKKVNVAFVADSYNHKIKRINTSDNTVSKIDMSNLSTYNEPGGLCLGANETKLYVADTNNHAIKILHLDNNYSVTNVQTLDITFLLENVHTGSAINSISDIFTAKSVLVNAKGGKLILSQTLELGDQLSLTREAPQKWTVQMPISSWSCVPSCGTEVLNVEAYLNIPPTNISSTKIDFIYNIIACKADVCIPKKFIIRQPIEFSENATVTEKHSLFVVDQSSINQKC